MVASERSSPRDVVQEQVPGDDFSFPSFSSSGNQSLVAFRIPRLGSFTSRNVTCVYDFSHHGTNSGPRDTLGPIKVVIRKAK